MFTAHIHQQQAGVCLVCNVSNCVTMSEMLLKEMEEVSLGQSKEEEESSSGRSFLLIDENESLQVNTVMYAQS